MARVVSALSFALLLAAVEIGSAYKCYQCNSVSDPTCADPFRTGTKNLVDCSLPNALQYNNEYLRGVLPDQLQMSVLGATRLCHKFVMKNGQVIRTCLDGNSNALNQTCNLFEQFSKLSTDLSRQLKHCSVCDKDGCNGASSISFSLPLAALALVASYLYYKN